MAVRHVLSHPGFQGEETTPTWDLPNLRAEWGSQGAARGSWCLLKLLNECHIIWLSSTSVERGYILFPQGKEASSHIYMESEEQIIGGNNTIYHAVPLSA